MKKLLGIVLLTGIVLSSNQSIFADPAKTSSYVDQRKAYLVAKIAAADTSTKERQNSWDEYNALCSGNRLKATYIKYNTHLKVAAAFAAGLIMLKGGVALKNYNNPIPENPLTPTQRDYKNDQSLCKDQSKKSRFSHLISDTPTKNAPNIVDTTKTEQGNLQDHKATAYLIEAQACLKDISSDSHKKDNYGLFWSKTKDCTKKALKYYKENNITEQKRTLLEKAKATWSKMPNYFGFSKIEWFNPFSKQLAIMDKQTNSR